MRCDDLGRSLSSLFGELAYGARTDDAFVLNPADAGLLAALDGLSAAEASLSSLEGATVAAHADHIRFGLSLLNRWATGEENPFGGADWMAAWRRTTVTDAEWAEVREGLRGEVEKWHAALQEPREVAGTDLDGVVASVVHLAYHFGAIRQIAPGTRGPKAGESV
jgi:hypothetical protein